MDLAQARQIERDDQAYVIAGWLLDKQGSPVVDGLVSVRIAGEDEPLAESESQEDGFKRRRYFKSCLHKKIE